MAMGFGEQGAQLQELLDLSWSPVGLAFRSEAPPGIQPITEAAASGCTYWKLAAEGQVFSTSASDHFNCPIGAYTHGIHMPSERVKELEGMVQTMVGIQYIKPEEVATLPQRPEPFGFAIYAPLSASPVDPDVVLVRGNPKKMMLLAEAARAAGLRQDMSAMLRPTCAIVAEAVGPARASLSLGCIGNRVYTELADEELYCAIPGPQLAAVIEKLETIIQANDQLESFHQERKASV